MPGAHIDNEALLLSLNRQLLELQHQFRCMAGQTPQPLAVEDARELWEAWADDIERIRADLRKLSPPRRARAEPTAGSRRLPGKPFTGTPPGLVRTPGDER